MEGPKELCQRLAAFLKERLGARAAPFLSQLQGCDTREALEEVALKVAVRVKLTLDKKTGEELERLVRELFR